MSTTEAIDKTESTDCKTRDAINDLVKQLLNQRAVFFVGAGFSLQDENVSTDKIMASLLCRFLAMTDPGLLGDNSPHEGLRQACDQLFGLWLCGEEGNGAAIKAKLNKNPVWLSSGVIKKLAAKYYQVNEWMVQCFGELYRFYHSREQASRGRFDDIHQKERKIRTLFAELHPASQGGTKPEAAMVEHSPLDVEFLSRVNAEVVGKVIFIETVGLGNRQTMQSYQDADAKPVSQRYHVFGKLAKEGLSPIVIATNYDLLIERGYQAVGLEMTDGCSSSQEGCSHLPKCVLPIRQPSDFFMQGSLNPAHILKVHGCAQQYRTVKKALGDAKPAELATTQKQFEDYLASIIYTYREIQHWRDDGWSRDYLQTLLRTKSFVFCGYSAADPVMHVTIRHIYEEMARKEVGQSSDAFVSPAFSTRGDALEFDSLEILNAASKAIGTKGRPDGHRAYLPFDYGNKTFPGCDCLFRTVLHRTLRQLQLQILTDHIDTLALTLFGKPKPAHEVNRLKERFNELIEQEKEQVLSDKKQPAEKVMEGQMAWTEHFPQQVLSLFQHAGARRFGKSTVKGYIPLRQYPVWSCFAILLELAIRHGYQKLFGIQGKLKFIHAIPGECPTAHICCDGLGPVAVIIADIETPRRQFKKQYYCSQTQAWRFNFAGSFRQAKTAKSDRHEMDVETIWSLACA